LPSRCRATNRYERRFNGALKLAINDGYAFVKDIPSGQPEPPRYFATMKRVNRDGIAVTGGVLSWATTQVPEITAAIQSFLNAGFRSAAQVEFVVIIGDEGLHPLQRWCGCRVSGILFLNMLSPTIVGKRPNSS
jgi:hypothetical protein